MDYSRLLFIPVAIVLLTTLFCSLAVVQSADVSESTGVLAYVIDSSCPSGWSDLSFDATYKGRLIKGWNSHLFLGNPTGSGLPNNDMPMHTHTSWSRRLYFGDSVYSSCSLASNPRFVPGLTEFHLSQNNSDMTEEHPRIQRVSLRLCRYTSGEVFNLPPGFVVFMHDSIKTCPEGFSNFTVAHGRFLVFSSSEKDMGSDLTSSASPALGSNSPFGYHVHVMPQSQVQMKHITSLSQTGFCCSTARGAKWQELRTMEEGYADYAPVNIPYVQLRACQATDETSTPRLPSSRLIFFYDGQDCPAFFREASDRVDGPVSYPFSNIVGRMIFNLYDENLEAGEINTDGDQLDCATGSCSAFGHAHHTHHYEGVVNLPSQIAGSPCLWDVPDEFALSNWTDYRNYNFAFETDPEFHAILPYRVLRACSSQEDTDSPSSNPSKTPSRFPSTSPSESPSANPSISPSESPSVSPSTTNQPSLTPVSSSTWNCKPDLLNSILFLLIMLLLF